MLPSVPNGGPRQPRDGFAEVRYRQLFDQMPVALYELDLTVDPPSIVALNACAGRLHGMVPSADAALSLDDLFPPSIEHRLGELMAAVRGGAAATIETTMQLEGPVGDLPALLELPLLRMVQEALNNAGHRSPRRARRLVVHRPAARACRVSLREPAGESPRRRRVPGRMRPARPPPGAGASPLIVGSSSGVECAEGDPAAHLGNGVRL